MGVNNASMAIRPFGSLLPQITEGFHRHRVALLLTLTLNVGDVLTTHFGLASGVSEGNPIPAMLLAHGGEVAMFGGKMAAISAVVLTACLLGRRYPKVWHTFTVTNLVLLAAIVSNSAQILAR